MASLVIAAGIFHATAFAGTPANWTQSPGFYKQKLGDFEVTSLYDGGGEIDSRLLHAEPTEIQALMREQLEDAAHIPGSLSGFLVNTGSKLILVDAGTGGHWGGPSLGGLVANLRLAGYRPEQVDLVLLTHLHADHVGGIYSSTGERVFPNAEVLVSKADSDFWLSPEVAKQAPKEAQIFFQIAKEAAAPYIAAHKWHPFAGTDELAPGVRPVPIAGHTPGHTGYEFTSKGQTLLVWGDVVHVVAVQMPHPEVSIAYDADGPTAVKSRQELFEKLAANGDWIAGEHMPYPALGRMRKGSTGYIWVPVVYKDKP